MDKKSKYYDFNQQSLEANGLLFNCERKAGILYDYYAHFDNYIYASLSF